MITYDFHTNSDILEIFLNDEVQIEDIILTVQYITENKKLPKNMKVIINAESTEYYYNPDDLNLLSSLLKNSFEKFIKIKCSYIDSEYEKSQIPKMFKNLSDSKIFKHKFFTTKEDAINWLN